MDSSCMNTHVLSNMLAKTKASLIERRKSENVGAKSWKTELRLKKELMSPQKPRSCPTTLHYRAFGDFPGAQNSYRRTNLNSSFRIFCSLKRVLLVYHDYYWMTKHGRGEGNGAKREQYLDWWNKNWLETRLSGNPPIFFICSSSGFLFAIPLTAHTSYYSVFSPSVICDTKLFNIHFDDLFRWTPFLILPLINIMSTNIIG